MKKNYRLVQKWTLLFLLVAGITVLHYITDQGEYYFHIFYKELYFLPIVLAAFWFGLRGALFVSVTITICFLPFIILHWQHFSPNDLDSILSLLLYNVLALFIGFLKDRETAARKKMSQAEHLAVMGRSLAAAAHDMKTPLMLIEGFARRILKKKDADDPDCIKLNMIIKETEKMECMTKDMLNFSKPLTLDRVQGDIDATVRESLVKVKEAARKRHVTVVYNSPPEVTDLSFDSLRVEQVITNLVLNAVEASAEGNRVEVTLSLTPAGMILDVADRGCGIPSADREKVFDPFFTTKKEGTGLGLPIVKKIIQAHGWSLQILEKGGCGTVFRINLMEKE